MFLLLFRCCFVVCSDLCLIFVPDTCSDFVLFSGFCYCVWFDCCSGFCSGFYVDICYDFCSDMCSDLCSDICFVFWFGLF